MHRHWTMRFDLISLESVTWVVLTLGALLICLIDEPRIGLFFLGALAFGAITASLRHG